MALLGFENLEFEYFAPPDEPNLVPKIIAFQF